MNKEGNIYDDRDGFPLPDNLEATPIPELVKEQREADERRIALEHATQEAAVELMFDLAVFVTKVHELPHSREKSCVLTKLDEARHWLRDIAKA